MVSRSLVRAALALGLVAVPARAAAQHHPAPIPAEDPRAVIAGAVVGKMLQDDRTDVLAYLAEHGDSAWVAGGGAAAELGPLMELVAEKPRAIEGYLAGPERSVLVVLMDEARDWLLVQVRLEPTPPFRVTGLARAELRPGGERRGAVAR